MKQMHKTMEDHPMNQDVFAGQWKQMRGELKSWWGKLADDDFDRIGGQKDKLIGLLQEKYGYAREQAQQEVEQHLKEYGDRTGGPNGAPHEGAIATAVAAIAGGLESASSYLQEQEFAAMATDLTALMRRYPIQSLLVGVGLGYVLARLTTR